MRRIRQIAQIASIVIALIAGPCQCERFSSIRPIYRAGIHGFSKYINSDAKMLTVVGTDLEAKKYTVPGKCFIFMKNISSRTEDLFLLKDEEDYNPNGLLESYSYKLYTERKRLKYTNTTSTVLYSHEKKILVVPYKNFYDRMKIKSQIEEAESLKRNKDVLCMISPSGIYIQRIIILIVCKKYIDTLNECTVSLEEHRNRFMEYLVKNQITREELEVLGFKDTFIYRLVSRITYCNPQAHIGHLLELYAVHEKHIMDIFAKNSRLSMNNLSKVDEKEAGKISAFTELRWILERIVKPVIDILKDRKHGKIGSSKKNYESEKIMKILSNTLVNNSFIYENNEKKIRSILARIEGKFNYSKEIGTIEFLVSDEKRQIVDIILSRLKDIDSDDITVLKGIIKKLLKGIVDVLVDKEIDPTTPEMVASINQYIEREEKLNKKSSPDSLICYISDLFKRFYKLCDRSCSDAKEHYELIKKISGVLVPDFKRNNPVDWVSSKIKNNNIDEIISIYKALCSIQIYNWSLESYDEIWKKPAVLVVKNCAKSYQQEKKTAVIYYSMAEGEILEKIVEFTDSLLEEFKNAQTIEDIDQIKGLHITSVIYHTEKRLRVHFE